MHPPVKKDDRSRWPFAPRLPRPAYRCGAAWAPSACAGMAHPVPPVFQSVPMLEVEKSRPPERAIACCSATRLPPAGGGWPLRRRPQWGRQDQPAAFWSLAGLARGQRDPLARHSIRRARARPSRRTAHPRPCRRAQRPAQPAGEPALRLPAAGDAVDEDDCVQACSASASPTSSTCRRACCRRANVAASAGGLFLSANRPAVGAGRALHRARRACGRRSRRHLCPALRRWRHGDADHAPGRPFARPPEVLDVGSSHAEHLPRRAAARPAAGLRGRADVLVTLAFFIIVPVPLRRRRRTQPAARDCPWRVVGRGAARLPAVAALPVRAGTTATELSSNLLLSREPAALWVMAKVLAFWLSTGLPVIAVAPAMGPAA